MMANNIIEANIGSDGAINNEELHKAITILKSEEEAGHELNINNMTQEYGYKLQDATTVNDMVNETAYTFLNHQRLLV